MIQPKLFHEENRYTLQKHNWAPAPALARKHARAKPALRCFYWGEEYPLVNLGDLLGRSIVEALGYACVPCTTDDSKVANPGRCLLTIGSLLNSPNLANIACSLDIWGCGWKGVAKTPAGCEAIRFFAVRGPQTAEGLRLPSGIALGDPALLLPKLFKWSVATHGKTVVIPHCSRLADMHTSQRCLLTGCDEVVSPLVVRSPWHQALQPASFRAAAGLLRRRARLGLRIHNIWSAVRRIAGADFVLTGSLHGSIIAQAFGVPWAMYDDGYIDAPAKWADWAAYLNTEIKPVLTLKDGRQWWGQVGCHARIRNLGPLLRAFPYEILNPKTRNLALELP